MRRSPSSWPELGRLVVLPAGLAIGVLSERAAYDWEDPRHWLPDLVVGLTFVAAATVVLPRRPGTGWLLAATGIAWFAGSFDSGFLYLHRGPLVHLIVAYVGWRARTRLDLVAIVVGYVTAVVASTWNYDAVAVALVAGLVAVVAHSMATATGRVRSERLAALQAAVVFALAVGGFVVVTRAVPSGEANDPMLLAYEAALCGIAVLLSVRLTGPSTAAVADLVVELGESPSDALRDALADALGDPTVEIGYWSPDGFYADERGAPLVLPSSDSGRAATFVERQSRPFAVLVHDASVLDEPAIADAVATATRLSAANDALNAEVRAQLDALAASRHRILVAVDRQRRALEMRLREGPEHRIVALAASLAEVPDDGRGHIRRAERHLEGALADLRDIAHGLHPRELDAGLRAALEALAGRCSERVELMVDADLAAPDEVAIAAYYVCAEALANVAKHAAASVVMVSVSVLSDRLVVTVTDDGVGGADPTGSGLRGLADRVEALGGSLTMSSPAGGPTRLAAELLLGRQLD